MTVEKGQQPFGDPNREAVSGVDGFLGANPLPGEEIGTPQRARVLAADDDKNMRFYIRQLLKAHYEVQVVADGAAALAAARAERPDLVLADVLMPGMDGIALLRALRADPDLQTIPVVLISARTEEDARAEGLEQGADDYIVKPFNARELLARIGTQLEMIRIRRGSLHEIERLLEENRRQRELLQRLFDHATDAIVLADPMGPGTVRAANPAACRMFGYSADEFVGLERAAMFSPGEQNLQALLAHRDAAGQAAAVLRYRRKDGSEFMGELSTALFSGSDGRGNSVAIIRDVTERQRAEEALRESKERLQLVIASGQVGTWDRDMDTEKTVWSDLLYDMLGRARGSAITGETFFEYIHPDDLSRVLEHVGQELAAGDEFLDEFRVIREDGEVRWLVSHGRVYRDADGTAARMAGINYDTTARKQTEESLRAAYGRLQTLFDHRIGGIGIVIGSTQGEIIQANDYYLSLLGCTRQELVSGQVDWREMTPPEWAPVDEQALAQLRGHGFSGLWEKEYVRRDGARVPVLITGAMMPGDSGEILSFVLDISERKQTEEALRESEERLRRIGRAGRIGLYEWNVDRDEAYWSPEMYELLGLEPGSPANYQRWIAAVHPDDREHAQSELAGPLEQVRSGWGGISLRHEYRVMHGDGTVLWLEATTVFDREGGNLILRGAVRDVSERRQSEEALRKSEAQIRTILESITDGFLTLDREWRYTYFNETGARMLGMRREDLLGGNVWELFPYAQDSLFYSGYHRAVETGMPVHFEAFYPEPLNMWLECHCYPSAEGLSVYFRDITERKVVEDALQRYTERLRFLHEVDEAILVAHSMAEVAQAVVDRAPRLLPCRRASAVLYEPQAGQVSLLAAYQDSGHGEPGRAWEGAADVPWNEVLERLAAGQAYEVADVQALPAGSPLVALLQGEGARGLIYEPIVIHGQFVGALKLGLDVPGPLDGEQREVVHELAVQLAIGLEQARLYEEVQRYAGDLEQLVEQRTAALIQTERLALMGRLAASLAHEINNPIQSVVGCLGLAIEVLVEGQDAGEYLTVAVEELERAARIVHQMRDLGRQDEGLKEPARVQELVSRVMILTQKQARNSGVQVTWEGPDGLPPVPMVRDQIQQVFLNLVLNAIDAMPQGGALRIRAAPTAEPQGLAVSFADTGVGILPQDVARLFQAFHSTKELGLGLGLYVSRNIVQAHEGWIDVQSEVGRGATFTVWLPGNGA